MNLQEGSWDSNWPSEAHFARLAVVKMNLARQEGLTTGVIVTQKPWILTTGDCLYRGGVAEEPNSIAVGASGLKAEADEGVAWIVFGFITMLCHLRVRDLRAQERETL
ncbi:MAG: hypothetical protein Q8Q24_02300 [bacterium]|nr:hypothetical protein [bacterium]